MSKISSLTKEQITRFPEWVDKWLRVGLSTERINFEESERAALACYQSCNLNRPIVQLRLGSPFGVTVGGAMAVMFLGDN